MLDILVLFLVGRHVYSIAKRKNRNPTGYVLLVVFAYIGLGIIGGIVSLILSGVDLDNAADNEVMISALPGILIGYALGVGLGYVVVCAVPAIPQKRRSYDDGDYDDYDDYDDRPRRRRRDEDPYDYEDDRPRSRRDDEDYDRPRSRRDDEDDYDRPRRRRDDY